MVTVLLLALLVGCARAQYDTLCECALFNSMQIGSPSHNPIGDNPIPLEYYGEFNVDSKQCDRTPGTVNDCMLQCQIRFENNGGLQADLCTRTNGFSPRCTGSQWCEALHNSGITNVRSGDGINSLYYRMQNCEGTDFVNWNYGFREISDPGLCCYDGRFEHCFEPCEESCEANNLCECGAFIGSQFNATLLPGTNPLPLHNIGTEWGIDGQLYCENWPGADFGHPCDVSCLFASQYYKAQINLGDPSRKNPSISYGDFYCQILKARWADQWPEGGIGPEEIFTYARMPGCDRNDGTDDHLTWNTERRYTCHHQALCCDGDGKRYRCEGMPDWGIPEYPN